MSPTTGPDQPRRESGSRGVGEFGTWLEAERIITEMLQIATLHLPLHETLRRCLDVLLKTSWLRVQDKGGIFLVGDDRKTLELFVDHRLGSGISSLCARVPFGQCLCGRAAASKTIQHAHCVDARHENRFAGMKPHGHYNVPILRQGEVLGVVVLYLPHGSKQDSSEVAFLGSVANILSLVIQLKSYETRLEDMVAARTRELEAEVAGGKRKEAALRRSESRLAELLELAPEAIVSVDDDGRIELFNRSAEVLFGYAKLEMLGKPLDLLLPERFRKRHLDQIHTFGIQGDVIRLMSQRGEIAGQRKDGTEFPARGAISRLGAENDRSYTILLQDITDMKKSEMALLSAKRAAESANRAKTEILANTSHEFKTPLNAIIGFSEMIAQETHGASGDSRYTEYGRAIRESGERLLGLVDDVLDVSRIETGETTLHEERIDIVDLLRNAVEMTKRRFERAPVTLVQEVDGDLPALRADKRMVKQILSNLLSNAVKFSPAGGIVSVRAWLDQGEHAFQVSDPGIGMDLADLEKALAPFGQLDGTLGRKYEGVGLGLTLVKLYTDIHGANLNIESKPGNGTTVTVRFPPERTV